VQDLNDLYYYVQAVDHGGFARAGRLLGIPKSKLSRRIATLEERLGVRLIQRSTRHFVVTEAGETYYTHCKAMLVEAEAAQEAIDTLKAEPRGVVRITCPLPLVHAYVGVMLADFMVRYPHVSVHMEATNRRVDLVSESVDDALRAHPGRSKPKFGGQPRSCPAARLSYCTSCLEQLAEPGAGDAAANPSLGAARPRRRTNNTSSHATLRDDGYDRTAKRRGGRCWYSATAGGPGARPAGGWFIG
jgi:DNA-binding transcriptional LysR family regulator